MAKPKIIALVDCDSFFVSVEQALKPELKNKPVCVLSNNDGCVIARSREAKALGITMGMPYFMAKREFKDCTYLSGNHDLYEEYSKKIMNVLRDFSPDVEVYSIDEAFVELTGLRRLYKMNYAKLALRIRSKIKEDLDIPVSIGLAPSKTLAKLASDKAKNTGGLYIIGSGKIVKELKNTKVDEIWGIGRNIAALLRKHGVLNAYELVSQSDEWLKSKISITAVELKHELMGESVFPVESKEKIPKSIQHTSSFKKFTSDKNFIINSLNYHIHRACSKLRELNASCLSVSIILRTKDFKTYKEKRILSAPVNFELEISSIAKELFEKIYSPEILYRSSGVVLDKFSFDNEEQLYLFDDNVVSEKKNNLAKTLDKIEKKYGKNTIKTGY
ncbi:Y-family DNA polymerase [bacterium]|nr:Y-family DNA polymerase [bacterium]